MAIRISDWLLSLGLIEGYTMEDMEHMGPDKLENKLKAAGRIGNGYTSTKEEIWETYQNGCGISV